MVVRWLVASGTVTIGLASGLGLLAGLDWRLDLFAQFRVQYVVGLVGLVAVAAAGRWWRWAAIAGGLLGLHLLATAPRVFAGAPTASGERLALLHFNVLSSNTRYADVTAWLAASGADVVFVQEVDARWAAALATVPGYRVVEMVPRADNFGLTVLARTDLAVEVLPAPDIGRVPVVVVRVGLAGRGVTVLGLHTLPPVSADYSRERDAQLVAAAAWARTEVAGGRAPVVLGDLNTTPFGVATAPLRGVLRDSLRGWQVFTAGTWPASLGPLGIAIDHCWHADALVTVARAVGPELGSDHRPLQVSLAWADG